MSEITDYLARAHYPFAFAIDLHDAVDMQPMHEYVAAPGHDNTMEATVRIGYFMDAPASWRTFLWRTTGHSTPGSHRLNGDDAAAIERHVRMVLADPDLAEPTMDADAEETVHTLYWENLSQLAAMFDRLADYPSSDYRLSYVILAEPGIPSHIERIIDHG